MAHDSRWGHGLIFRVSESGLDRQTEQRAWGRRVLIIDLLGCLVAYTRTDRDMCCSDGAGRGP